MSGIPFVFPKGIWGKSNYREADAFRFALIKSVTISAHPRINQRFPTLKAVSLCFVKKKKTFFVNRKKAKCYRCSFCFWPGW